MNPAQPNGLDTHLVNHITGFHHHLRTQGFHIGIAERLDSFRLAQRIKLLNHATWRAGLRSLLCGHQRDWRRFDELFNAYWLSPARRAQRAVGGGGTVPTSDDEANGLSPDLLNDIRQGGGDAQNIAGDRATQGGASDAESLQRRDFRFFTRADERNQLDALVDRLARRMRKRMIRRHRVAHAGRQLHLRRTLRNSLPFGGTPLKLCFRRHRRRPPHVLMLLDVSRSMSVYTYMLLRFVRAMVGAFKQADAFVFHTHLVSVTDALRERNRARMRDRLALLSSGWSGGTRIGESLHQFNQRFAHRLNRRSLVVILSDGFDTGEPTLLGRELQCIRRRARRIIWLNPLLGRLAYQPKAAGMQAALPWLDLFAPAHNLESLLALEPELVKL